VIVTIGVVSIVTISARWFPVIGRRPSRSRGQDAIPLNTKKLRGRHEYRRIDIESREKETFLLPFAATWPAVFLIVPSVSRARREESHPEENRNERSSFSASNASLLPSYARMYAIFLLEILLFARKLQKDLSSSSAAKGPWSFLQLLHFEATCFIR